MPEGDTVYRTAAKLREALAGKTLTRCDVRVPKFATVDLTGIVVDEVISRGKHLFIRAGDASIHSHLKMDGAWLVGGQLRRVLPTRSGSCSRRTTHGSAASTSGCWRSWSAPTTWTPSRIWARTCSTTHWEPRIAAANLMADPDRPLAEALLDQRVMAGVGNVYANELCFVMGHLPTGSGERLKDPLRVVQRARDMLWLNRSRVNRTTTGDTRPGRDLWVYGRAGQACRRCGTSDRVGSSESASASRSGVPSIRPDAAPRDVQSQRVLPLGVSRHSLRTARGTVIQTLGLRASLAILRTTVRELLGQRALVVGHAVPLADLLDLFGDLGVAVRRDVREQVVLDLERQVAAHDVEQLAAGQVRRAEHLAEVPHAAGLVRRSPRW